MDLGLHVSDFTWPGGAPALAPTLARIARDAEEAGFARLSVMDHFWQIAHIGPPEHEMLEAYTTLGFLAANTTTITLTVLVTGVVYREPGLLAKAVTTLDVLSGGRAMLGIGAAWFEGEARGLGLAFPPLAERFERLKPFLGGTPPGTAQADAAQAAGMSEGAFKVALHRLRRRYRDLLREEVAQTLDAAEDVDDEIRALLQSLSA